jgi:hypothetical protein
VSLADYDMGTVLRANEMDSPSNALGVELLDCQAAHALSITIARRIDHRKEGLCDLRPCIEQCIYGGPALLALFDRASR